MSNENLSGNVHHRVPVYMERFIDQTAEQLGTSKSDVFRETLARGIPEVALFVEENDMLDPITEFGVWDDFVCPECGNDNEYSFSIAEGNELEEWQAHCYDCGHTGIGDEFHQPETKSGLSLSQVQPSPFSYTQSGDLPDSEHLRQGYRAVVMKPNGPEERMLIHPQNSYNEYAEEVAETLQREEGAHRVFMVDLETGEEINLVETAEGYIHKYDPGKDEFREQVFIYETDQS